MDEIDVSDQPLTVDLHNHPFEAMGVGRAVDITVDHIWRIAEAAQAGGVDVLGITEHGGWQFGRRAVELARGLDLPVILLAGQEDWYHPVEVVEVALPSGRVFRFLAHPGAPAPWQPVWESIRSGLTGIEVENRNHQWHMPRGQLDAFATRHGLMAMRSSDAHDLAEVGDCATKASMCELEELAARTDQAWNLADAVGTISR